MSIAYLVLAHAADEQLELQVTTLLEDEASFVYLHLDLKCLSLGWLETFRHPRLCVLRRFSVNWAGCSIVRATRAVLEAAYRHRPNEKFVLLSGSCFPLMAAAAINASLHDEAGSIVSLWGEIDPRGDSRQLGRSIVSRFYPYDIAWLNPHRGHWQHLLWSLYCRLNRRLGYRRRLDPIRLWKGSMFFVIDRELAGLALADQPRLDEALRYSHAPDEIFFSTLYAWQLERRGDIPRLVAESDDLQGRHFIRKHGIRRSLWERLTRTPDDRRLRPEDIPDALASGALFARKCGLAVCRLLKDGARA